MMFSINTVFVATALFASAQAFSTGAGGCEGGQAAVAGFHLAEGKAIETGSLEDGGVGLYLNDVLLDPTTVVNFTANGLNFLSLNGTSDYRGLLVRASSNADTEFPLMELSDDLQDAAVCTAPITGITHTNSDLKNNHNMSLFLGAGDLSLDVTVVFANNNTDSIYYYSSYMLNAVAANDAFPVCEVCGAGLVISNPGVIITNPLDGTTPTCAQIQESGRAGLVNPSICPFVPLSLGACGCVAASSGLPSSMSPSMAPSVTASADPSASPSTAMSPTTSTKDTPTTPDAGSSAGRVTSLTASSTALTVVVSIHMLLSSGIWCW
jgi:hypothetical protein